jgi:hypothetical protein
MLSSVGIPVLPGESWAPIPWAPEYFVSDQGRVARVRGDKARPAVIGRHGRAQILVPMRQRQPSRRDAPRDEWYCRVWIQRPGENWASRRSYAVHRLVAEAFVPRTPEDSGLVVNHIDGNPGNNAALNLEWCSRSENGFRWTFRDSTSSVRRFCNPTIVEDLLARYDAGATQKQLAEHFATSQPQISNVLRRNGRRTFYRKSAGKEV